MVDVSHTLTKIIENNKLSHAYLFESDSMETLKAVSIEFATQILSNDVRSKQMIESFNHPDFYYLETDAATIKKEDVQDLMYQMSQKPVQSNFKVYIIEAFDKLTVQAENSILKFLEEPPKNTIAILLTTDKSSILPTTLSRSQYIYVPRRKDESVEVLEDLPEKLQEVVKDYGLDYDHVLDLEDRFSKIVTASIRVVELWLKNDSRALIRLTTLTELCKERRDYFLVLTLLDGMMREAMYNVLNIDYKKHFDVSLPKLVNVIQLTKNLEKIEEANKMLNFNVNSMLVMESMIISSKG